MVEIEENILEMEGILEMDCILEMKDRILEMEESSLDMEEFLEDYLPVLEHCSGDNGILQLLQDVAPSTFAFWHWNV